MKRRPHLGLTCLDRWRELDRWRGKRVLALPQENQSDGHDNGRKLVFQQQAPLPMDDDPPTIKAGLKRAVAQGVKLSRPKIDGATERKVRKQLAKGVGILKVARSLGIGTGTVHRISNELG